MIIAAAVEYGLVVQRTIAEYRKIHRNNSMAKEEVYLE
jgi:hypothetical protein